DQRRQGLRKMRAPWRPITSEVIMKLLPWAWVLVALVAHAPLCPARAAEIAPDLARISDAKVWSVINADCATALEDGQSVVRWKPKAKVHTPSNVGLALVEGVEFTEGTLEVDLKGKGKFEASFLGVAFGVADGKSFEAVYFRPFNFMREDKALRAHA